MSKSMYGYTHYTHEPTTPNQHDNLLRMPQMMTDSCLGFCSCGEWETHVSTWEFPAMEDAAAEVARRWQQHKQETIS